MPRSSGRGNWSSKAVFPLGIEEEDLFQELDWQVTSIENGMWDGRSALVA